MTVRDRAGSIFYSSFRSFTSLLLRLFSKLCFVSFVLILCDYESDYFELLKKKKHCTLYSQRLQDMCCEIYKTINCNSSAYMNDLLIKRQSNYKSTKELNLHFPRVNQITFGYKSFSVVAPKIWNSIPMSIRASDVYKTFQLEIKKITLPWCFCNNCYLKQRI